MQPNACAIRKLKGDSGEMSGSDPKGEPTRSRARQQDGLPDEIVEIIGQSIQMGALSGASGLLFGSFAGVIRSKTPALFALATGIQWLTLGTTFAASRGIVLHAWGKDKVTPRDQIYASAIAGAVSGTAGGFIRGPKNVLPGAIIFALFGATGQALINRSNAPRTEVKEANPRPSWMDSKWSPVKLLSDREYESILREKVLGIDAEIALIDEKIEALQAQERRDAERKSEGRFLEK